MGKTDIQSQIKGNIAQKDNVISDHTVVVQDTNVEEPNDDSKYLHNIPEFDYSEDRNLSEIISLLVSAEDSKYDSSVSIQQPIEETTQNGSALVVSEDVQIHGQENLLNVGETVVQTQIKGNMIQKDDVILDHTSTVVIENNPGDEQNDESSDLDYIPESDIDYSEDSNLSEVFPLLGSAKDLKCDSSVLQQPEPVEKTSQNGSVFIAGEDVQAQHQENFVKLGKAVVQSQINGNMVQKDNVKYKRPSRPCPFCRHSSAESKLSRHISKKHKDIEEVKRSLNLPRKERLAKFKEFKMRGIHSANKPRIAEKSMDLIRERRRGKAENLVTCGRCQIFIKKENFRKHALNCRKISEESSRPVVPISPSLYRDSDSNLDFTTKILSKFTNDEAGKLCRTDAFIKMYGLTIWNSSKNKEDKITEVRKSVMTDMRRLAMLFTHFSKSERSADSDGEETVRDMFKRANFGRLESAIDAYCTTESGIKPGLKRALRYVITNAANVIKAKDLTKDTKEDDCMAEEIEKFLSIFKMNCRYLFGDAEYLIQKGRQIKLRKPEELPTEEEIKTVRDYTVKTLEEMTDPYIIWGQHEFKALRDLLICRLTLFNARRGGEPSRLLLSEWEDAKKGVWLPPDRVEKHEDELSQALMKHTKIAYQSGKGTGRLVSLFIPNDCVRAMNIITDKKVRQDAKIPDSMKFVFPMIYQSEDHSSGWHSVRSIVEKAGIEVQEAHRITATKMRHRTSTLYAMLELPPRERECFYKHMGHSAEINEHIYQTPMAVAAMTNVAKHLHAFDKGESLSTAIGDSASSGTGKRLQIPNSKDGTFDQVAQTDISNSVRASTSISCDSIDFNAKGRDYTKWSNQDTHTIRSYFKEFIETEDNSSEMPVPGKSEVKEFLSKHPQVKDEIKDMKLRVLKVKTKIFNERNRFRNKLQKQLKNMTCH